MTDTLYLDAPCARGIACTASMRHRGGVDQHHVWPLSWGGTAAGPLRLLCPNHHRRQHSLLAAFHFYDGQVPAAIRRRFARDELSDATSAFEQWVAAGRPPIHGEPAPPAGE